VVSKRSVNDGEKKRGTERRKGRPAAQNVPYSCIRTTLKSARVGGVWGGGGNETR